MADIVTKIGYAMSLRKPQQEALSYLEAISTHCDYKKDSKTAIEAVATEYCEKHRKIRVDDKFDFPSFCYAMATGIGKTRLMGACMYYLYKTKGYRHFFILAPGNTIYEKLRKESNPNHPKYIFKGLEAEMGRPKVYDGENYDSYPVRYEQMSLQFEKSSEIELFIFNIGKIFNSKTDSQFNFHKFKETLGMSFAEVLSSFDDLVICMDEAHRYYAPASMKAINFLKPVLGLEFTATPKSANNVIYAYPKYGKEPISIGFWVGGGVTPNKFDELVEKADKPGEARRKRNLLYKQLLTCPFCGKPLTEDEFYIDPDRKSVAIYCADRNCMFYKYKQDRIRIPVYLVDEEIYAKCPTIILSTVDKFARLPWDVKTNALFGRVDRVCSRDGYVAIGEEHKRHNRTQELPASTLTPIRPFLPPELIIQDELHLITGPLGTVYGAYETIIEDMCTYGDKRIKPKYVVSTATIKNASEQTRCLYARQSTAQFPPNGFEIGDSFFINEISTKDDPFRKYVGVCAPGQSVKTTLLRMYAIILQTSYQLAQQDEYKNVIDPYYSLVGYYNSIRELGGAVRLLQDDHSETNLSN